MLTKSFFVPCLLWLVAATDPLVSPKSLEKADRVPRSAPLQSLPQVFEKALQALKSRVADDLKKVTKTNTTSTSEVVKELLHNGFDKFETELTMQQLNKIVSQGAPQVVKMLAGTSCDGQPPEVCDEINKAFAGVLNASEPVVYTSLGCDKVNVCRYFFLMGRTDLATNLTDLIVLKQSAPFKLAPELIVVRETNTTTSPFGNHTTVEDKIKKVPREVTQKDIDGILAFFEVTTVQKLEQASECIGECVQRLLLGARNMPGAMDEKKIPDMEGHSSEEVPSWQKMIDDNKDSSAIMGDIAAGMEAGAVFGPEGAAVGAVVGGLVGFIPEIAKIFHTSSVHSDTIVGILQKGGFSHFEMNQTVNTAKGVVYNPPGTDVKPVDILLKSFVSTHLDGMPDKDKEDIQNYVMFITNQWLEADHWSHHGFVFNHGAGTIKVAKLIASVNKTANTADLLMWSTTAYVVSAPTLVIHRVVDQHSNIFTDKSTSKDVIKEIPATWDENQTLALMSFFDIMAFNSFATDNALCKAGGLNCGFPDISPNKTIVV